MTILTNIIYIKKITLYKLLYDGYYRDSNSNKNAILYFVAPTYMMMFISDIVCKSNYHQIYDFFSDLNSKIGRGVYYAITYVISFRICF